jgi:putative transposase
MEFYHVLNRGVDKRNIVEDDTDRARFIHDLYIFNDANPALNFLHYGRQHSDTTPRRRLLVYIHAFCLMKNHYHLLLSEVVEGGISLFMKKLNMGYTKYFNERYERTGTLWQGKYKSVSIVRDAHFLYVPFYIHLNPLDYVMPEWRRGEVRTAREALKHLEQYRWSSHLDYLGKKNFPSLIDTNEIRELISNPASYKQTITEIVSDPVIASGSEQLE